MHHFDDLAQRSARACLAYAWERLSLDPAPLDGPRTFTDIEREAGRTITDEGRDPEEVLRVFTDVLAPACLSSDSPRFLAFIPAAPTKTSLVFDTVVAASSICATSWLEAAGAVYAENEALRYIADLAGMRPEAGGCFVSGASIGNLSALAVARETAAARASERPRRWRVAVSDEAHSSVFSTLRILDCDALVVPTTGRGGMSGDALNAILEDDPDPASVCGIGATAGTTNAGAIDDLTGLATVARERGLWLHVDAAYGGAALAARSARSHFDGIEQADSLVIDPHKWLFAPFDSCALVYRDPAAARQVHAQHAAYLDPMHVGTDWNPADYACHLTRRARGLPFWFSLAVHGTRAYGDAIEHVLDTARAAAGRVRAAGHVELVLEPELSVVLFRRIGWAEADYLEWSRRLLADQVALLMPTRWRGETVARAVFLNPTTTLAIFDEVLASMR